jgi:hypothetical protein
LRLRHGAYSSRTTDPIARELVEGLLADRPDVALHPEAVWSWASAEAKTIALDAWLADHGLVDGDGELYPAEAAAARWSRRAELLRARLGLDPRSEADLARARADAHHAAVDLDGLRARGREILEARAVDAGTRDSVESADDVPEGGDDADA